MRLTSPKTLTLFASVLASGVLGAGCHSHKDGSASGGPGAGSGDSLILSSSNPLVRQGQLTDISAVISGFPALIDGWDLLMDPGGQLIALDDPSRVRLVVGDPGVYIVQATDSEARAGVLDLIVQPTDASLIVTQVILGTDEDDVAARMTVSGPDHFVADRVGDASAIQHLARVRRDGVRELEVMLPFKVDDIAADELGHVMVLRPGPTLTDALLRVDRDLVEQGGFAAPDLEGALWSSVIAVTRTGRTVLATNRNGGQLIQLEADGSPVGGSLDASALPLPVPFADVVDLTAGLDDEIYVATATAIERILPDGTVDYGRWDPADQVAILAIDADACGVLHVALQDSDGGQCGSIRQLNWLGGEIRRLSDFLDPDSLRFAARKVINPQDIAAYSDGSWRMYDDTVSVHPTWTSASWIVAGDVPQP
ncbi:MAG: hypothetical protein VX015_14110 [Planctomycetota bacterium]|nr:hypothetical protein [Planctomycetota bacterium]